MKRFRRLVRESSGTLRSWLGGLLASVALSSTLGYAADVPAPGVKAFPGTLTLHDETLAARVAAVPLGQVMAEFSRLSGAKILWRTPVGKELVSVDFPARPLSEALERLLREKNFVLFYTAAGQGMRPTQIWISAREKSQGRPLPKYGSGPARVLLPPPVRQASPPPLEDRRYSQTAIDAQDPPVRLSTITQSRRETKEDPRVQPLPSPGARSDSSPPGQEAVATASLLGGSASSAAGVPKHCMPKASATSFADVTGDGQADAITVTDKGITVRCASTAGFLPNEPWTTEPYSGSRGTFFADVTGDGQADAIAVTDKGVTVRRSDGTQFLSSQPWTADPYYGKVGTSFADVTGDGRADAIAVNTDKIAIRPSTGAGFLSLQAWPIDSASGDLSPTCMD